MHDLVITTMLILQEDGHLTRPLDEYLTNFEKLIATGLPIVLYLDRSLVGQVSAPNVTVIPSSIQDLPLWRETRGLDMRLPTPRNMTKDTADYLLIVNSKTELIRRTILSGPPAALHAFVDFGLFHVIQDVELAQSRLRLVRRFPAERLVIPGCFDDRRDVLEPVNWRFCGGFFYGPSDAMLAFADLHRESVRALLPALTWDVNAWAWMEVNRGWASDWYRAGFDDTILDYLHIFAQETPPRQISPVFSPG